MNNANNNISKNNWYDRVMHGKGQLTDAEEGAVVTVYHEEEQQAEQAEQNYNQDEDVEVSAEEEEMKIEQTFTAAATAHGDQTSDQTAAQRGGADVEKSGSVTFAKLSEETGATAINTRATSLRPLTSMSTEL